MLLSEAIGSTSAEVLGRLPHSSNATLLVAFNTASEADENTEQTLGVYKPLKGEKPLSDFPPGLYKREIAAYELSRFLGWDIVPETIEYDGPLGVGSLQKFLHVDPQEHYFTLKEHEQHHEVLQKICLFDFVANNSDRKSGHCLLNGEKIVGIDHGLTFHHQFKLRTVIWDFIDAPFPPQTQAALSKLTKEAVDKHFGALLSPLEQDALVVRAKALVDHGRLPPDDTDGYRWPWPLV